MRRLLVPSAEDYDDQEYEEAAEEFLSAMKQLVTHSRCAHNRARTPGKLPKLPKRSAYTPGMPCSACCQSSERLVQKFMTGTVPLIGNRGQTSTNSAPA